MRRWNVDATIRLDKRIKKTIVKSDMIGCGCRPPSAAVASASAREPGPHQMELDMRHKHDSCLYTGLNAGTGEIQQAVSLGNVDIRHTHIDEKRRLAWPRTRRHANPIMHLSTRAPVGHWAGHRQLAPVHTSVPFSREYFCTGKIPLL